MFNLDTLEMIFSQFSVIHDVIEKPIVDIEEFIPKLAPLTKRLQLDSDYQTYMLGLYLKYLVKTTGN